jgi:outer membrane protein OmpA-like peptidoglycan-associated protein
MTFAALGLMLPHTADAQDATSGARGFVSQKELVGKLIPITGDHGAVDLDILFKFGSAVLTDEAAHQLEALAGALASPELQAVQVSVNGHTDSVGSAKKNKALSEKRAAAVVQYLVQKHRLDARRFTAKGYGEEELLAHIAAESKYQRRVQIVTTLPKPESADEGNSGIVIIK